MLHLSASGISVAAACAEAAICTDKSLINTHKQQSDPLHRHRTDTDPFILFSARRVALTNQIVQIFQNTQ